MSHWTGALIALAFLAFALVSRKLSRSIVTGPMLFAGFGLLIGMPLAVGLGTLAALGLFPGWSPWEAALLAAILTPTDAALGQAVTESETVPDRIRTAIGSESGLNDGLALPLVVLFAALASAGNVVFCRNSSRPKHTCWC